MQRRRRQRGLTLVELIVAFTIMFILTTMAVPLARGRVRRERERDLRYALREVRTAIDKYKDMKDAGYLGQMKQGTEGYPETLEILVEGEKTQGADGKKVRFLRHIPKDPFTGSALLYVKTSDGYCVFSAGRGHPEDDTRHIDREKDPIAWSERWGIHIRTSLQSASKVIYCVL